MTTPTDLTTPDPRGRLGLGAGQLSVDGIPSVLLCASVFPFRLPPSTWEHRLRLVRESGYRMVDLYVHWGFHEPVEGSIDLASPERDLARFLDLCAEQDLLVMARPGPYICSETDGGGLPAWLHGDRGGRGPVRIRSTDAEYLAAVDRWYRAVMPVLAAAQTSRGGPVALVQIENELDFYDCPDAPEYMDHLARTARGCGIDVPIIACAGQGDAVAATGGGDGVVPTYNLYPDDASPWFEREVRHDAALTRGQGLPLMVTETNRLHRTLRREILGGARLVAPYLQVGGFDHLVAPSAGNWGDPGSLMTHDYDFAGYVTPDGRRTPEYVEARRLARTLEAWGERLAAARPVPLEDVAVPGTGTGGALALTGGGHVVGHAELTGQDTTARIGRGETSLEATVAAGTCPFWCSDVPLDPWGRTGTLTAAAELVGVHTTAEALVLSFVGGADAQVRIDGPATPEGHGLSAPGGRGASTPAWGLHQRGQGTMSVVTPEGTIRVEITLRPEATAEGPVDPEPAFTAVPATATPVPDPMLTCGNTLPERYGTAPQAETVGLGAGRLRTTADVPAGTREVLLLGAADLVRVDVDGTDHGVEVRHGAPIEVPVDPTAGHELTVTTEIWGHANFDDARRPALVLGSSRGPGRVLAIDGIQDFSALWEVSRYPSRAGEVRNGARALRDIGGWSSSRHGGSVEYVRPLPADGPDGSERRGGVGDDSSVGPDGTGATSSPVALRLRGLRAPATVRLGDGRATQLFPGNDTVALEPTAAGTPLRVSAPHVPDGFCDGAELLWGSEVHDWSVQTLTPQEVAEALAAPGGASAGSDGAGTADGSGPVGGDIPVPWTVGAGEALHVRVSCPAPAVGTGLLLDLQGRDVQVTVAHHGRPVSRHVLGDAATSGGDPGRSWIPAEWIAAAQADGTVTDTVPADGTQTDGTVTDTAGVDGQDDAPRVLIDLLVEPLTTEGGVLDQVRVAAAAT